MKRSEIIKLQEGLINVSEVKGVKFAYAIAKNRQLIDIELKSIQEANKPSEKFIEFDKKRLTLCVQHSKKDDKNNPIVINNQYDILDLENFNKELEQLRERYIVAIKEDEKRIEEFNKFLDENIKIELFTFNKAALPENINANQVSSIMAIIE